MQEFWIKTVSVLLIAGVLLGYNTKLEDRKKEEEIAQLQAQVETLELAKTAGAENAVEEGLYQDGIYTGEASGFGGVISVEVTVEEGKITNVEVVSAAGEDGAFLSMAKDVIPEIIENQSADVDTVSGATFSSTGIREAAREALEKAGQ